MNYRKIFLIMATIAIVVISLLSAWLYISDWTVFS
jgi:hypothetical protein